MKIRHMLLLFFLILFSDPAWGDAPHKLGGFVLGDKVENHKEQLKLDTIMKIRHMECLYEIETKPITGFKSGLVYYGSCTGDKRIIRIKLKYINSSEKFYEQLLKRFKGRFGEPDEWRGDPFHVVVAWKWYFTDKDGNRISMILQHNIQSEDAKKGNSIKLTMTNLMESERNCYRKNKDNYRKILEKPDKTPPDWKKLIPE